MPTLNLFLQAKPSKLVCESTKPHWSCEDPFGDLSMGRQLGPALLKSNPRTPWDVTGIRGCAVPTILCFLPSLDIPQGEHPPTSPWVCALPSTSVSLFGEPSQPCCIIVVITTFYISVSGEEGPSGLSLQVFNWVFPDCLAFGLSGLHWDKFLTSKLCLLILNLKVSFLF